MGRNNRARRQKKQRDKKKKQNRSGSSSKAFHSHSIAVEMEIIGGPVLTALAHKEPPPPSFMADWLRIPLSPKFEKLRSLIVGFIDYLYHDGPATGELDVLTPFKNMMQSSGLVSVYPLLFSYCLISENDLAQGSTESLVQKLQIDTLQRHLAVDQQGKIDVLCAPFYLFLHAMKRPLPKQARGNVRFWLQDWLFNTPLYRLVPPLSKFLNLKGPKPKQKTVIALEDALNRFDWDDGQNPWQEGLGLLLHTFLDQRLGPRQRNSNTWSELPCLSAIAGLIETQAREPWSQISIDNTDTATISRLDRLVDGATLPYAERLQFEALKCRILAPYQESGKVCGVDFDYHLGLLLNLLSSGVPPQDTRLAEHCLDATCEWLADEVSRGHLPVPAIDRLHRIYRLRPDDYRLAILVFLASDGRQGATAKHGVDRPLQHIHFDLINYTLNNHYGLKGFVKSFYWPLAGEVKKELLVQYCRNIFFGLSDIDAHIAWETCHKWLVDVTQEPFASIVRGHACESEMLLYTSMAIIAKESDIGWLNSDDIALLLRAMGDLLAKHPGEFGQGQLIDLLNTLAGSEHASRLFHSWDPILVIVRNIESPANLSVFLTLALQVLNEQPDRHSEKYAVIYTATMHTPSLRKLSQPSRKKNTRKGKNQKSQPSPNLDLYDDL